jgi:hypothetical protein
MTVIFIAVDVIDTTGAEHQCNLLENSVSLVARCDLDFLPEICSQCPKVAGADGAADATDTTTAGDEYNLFPRNPSILIMR